MRILALNDFHGRIPAGRLYDKRPIGGAGVVAAYLQAAAAELPDRTLIVASGDNVGASPLPSALLMDEPTIMFFNQLGNTACSTRARLAPRCNIVATLGNHEFDRGVDEMLRLYTGGNSAQGPFLQDPWLGASFPLVSANVVWADSGKPILPPYLIKTVPYRDASGQERELPIAFVGATTRDTPNVVKPSGTAKVRFLDEADAINQYIPEIQAKGVHAIVVIIHEGGQQAIYNGVTDPDKPGAEGAIVEIIKRLDDDVDVVSSAHTHAFGNALVKSRGGKPVLLTQAMNYGTAVADIQLDIDPASDEVVSKKAEIRFMWADAGPGLQPVAKASALAEQATQRVAAITERQVASIEADILREATPAGESALGNLVADTQRAATGSDIAFINNGGLREDLRWQRASGSKLANGTITFGDAYSVQPFQNNLIRMTLTGEQLFKLLNQQFDRRDGEPNFLHASGLSYSWDSRRAAGDKVVSIEVQGKPINRQAGYTVVVNNFLAEGGDSFPVFKQGQARTIMGGDLDAFLQYIAPLTEAKQALRAPKLGERVKRLDL
ncbi:bifunctional metallophosphatase/5'-nucleotidase [Chitinimonas naiadis]